MSTDDALDQLRAALAEPRDPDARSYDPRKPHLATAAREAYVARQEQADDTSGERDDWPWDDIESPNHPQYRPA